MIQLINTERKHNFACCIKLRLCATPKLHVSTPITVQLDNRIIYCAAKHEKATILKYDEQMGIDKIRTDLSRVTRFSVADDKIATTKLTSSTSDIIRTNF